MTERLPDGSLKGHAQGAVPGNHLRDPRSVGARRVLACTDRARLKEA
ncbi:hypothetical protein LUX01_14505 [Streptomyces sudanensis]|nr:hypothetical protein [Streptomyces sudanensis]MCP9987719.1 hypothetical protein [Streptomyces sudanensis]